MISANRRHRKPTDHFVSYNYPKCVTSRYANDFARRQRPNPKTQVFNLEIERQISNPNSMQFKTTNMEFFTPQAAQPKVKKQKISLEQKPIMKITTNQAQYPNWKPKEAFIRKDI